MFNSGQILQERYQLQKQLGHTMAGRQTWLAEDLNNANHELVILKLLVFSNELNWDDVKLFEREAQVLQNLNHQRIPRYRDYFLVDQKPGSGLSWWGLVQDYIPGSTLQELLAKGTKFSEPELKEIAKEILSILIYLHQLNPPVLHRDIKPSNLIQGEDKQIYLVDFGAVQDRMAVTGLTFTVVGTVGYTPMEQFWGRAVPASDLYGLGATLIHLITGVAPCELPQNNLRIQFADYTSVSANFVNWIEKLTEPALEKRFTTAHEALELLFQRAQSSSNQILSPKNNPFIHLVRPFLVVTKKSTEVLEIYRYKEPIEYKKMLILVPVFLFFLGGFQLLGISAFIMLLFPLLRWKVLDDSTNKEIEALIKKLFNQNGNVNSIKRDQYGGYIRFDAKEKNFVFQNSWFGKFESSADFIANIRSIYVCQQNETRSNGFYQTRVNDWQVVIRTDRHRIRLNWRLNEEECGWLVHEIQTWLNHS
ncbi:serine/threonine protein kinase [Nodularia sphaerocarpa]|uniref:serine/threonine protein kinase n=1 Tax=Nodularia sphaerocarpa TaxID=137816 RepID=UPI001EFBD4A9|nr:serine/threonine-protein kinase [Nodularia sphaerocarpa]MDB9374771.1 serine/threonine-protein kinase [Nodularia sphaerocarpa CS-585]MDB9378365.1 serine/threonine-protein kinase [Nodularia sphaerocarpa CS-585A2]ULP70571.1 Serine/threonine-protein kinase B [Nodularia sphaerocarpa UHCC 0038]